MNDTHSLPKHGYEIIAAMVEQAGSAKTFRDKVMQLNPRTVNKLDVPTLLSWCSAPVDFNSIDPITRLLRLIAATGRLEPMHWICGRAGCHFVHGHKAFEKVYAQGSLTWFDCGRKIQRIRQKITDAFIHNTRNNSLPEIDEVEGREIAREWAGVFAWIEGFLTHAPVAAQSKSKPTAPSRNQKAHPTPHQPILFRTSHSHHIIAEVIDHPKSFDGSAPSRDHIAEQISKLGNSRGSKGEKNPSAKNHKNILNKWATPTKDQKDGSEGSLGPLDYVLAITQASGSWDAIEFLAKQLGGSIVIPDAKVKPLAARHLLDHWELTTVELAELDAAIARALLDDKLTPKEKNHLLTEWKDVVQWMNHFVAKW